MKVLIIDDEELARISLAEMLESVGDLEIAGFAVNGPDALKKIIESKPDAIFLDVEMPGLNGFEVLENLPQLPLVVFATAYDEYAVKAFEEDAVDYLLKPFQAARVRQTLERLRMRLAQKDSGEIQTLKTLLAKLQSQTKISKIVARRSEHILLVPLREVISIFVEDTMVYVQTAKERLISDKTIGELERRLPQKSFFRINRSAIVNLEQVTEIIPWFSGTLKLKLSSGQEIQVSRQRARLLKANLF